MFYKYGFILQGWPTMQNDIPIDIIRSSDPNALNCSTKDREGYYVAKRLLDFSIAWALLILLSPLMLMIAFLIFIYSPGPIFFVQERVGAKRQSRGDELTGKRRFSAAINSGQCM